MSSPRAAATAWVVDTRFADRAALVPFQTQQQANGSYKLRFTANTGGTGKPVAQGGGGGGGGGGIPGGGANGVSQAEIDAILRQFGLHR